MVVAGFLSEALRQNEKLTLDLGASTGQGGFYLRALRPTSPAHPEVWEPAFEMPGFYSEALKQNHQLTLDLGANAGNVMFGNIRGCLGQKGQPTPGRPGHLHREDPFLKHGIHR